MSLPILHRRDTTGAAKLPKGVSAEINRCMNYIQSHTNGTVTVEDVAAQVHRSSSYLMRRFKAETGMRVGDYILSFFSFNSGVQGAGTAFGGPVMFLRKEILRIGLLVIETQVQKAQVSYELRMAPGGDAIEQLRRRLPPPASPPHSILTGISSTPRWQKSCLSSLWMPGRFIRPLGTRNLTVSIPTWSTPRNGIQHCAIF